MGPWVLGLSFDKTSPVLDWLKLNDKNLSGKLKGPKFTEIKLAAKSWAAKVKP